MKVLAGVSTLVMFAALPAFAKPVNAVVRLKERVSMETLAKDVQNPYSLHYGTPYTPAEIRAIAAPNDTDYVSTVANLRAQGFTIVAESPTHLWVSVRGEKRLFENTFSTRIELLGKGVRQHRAGVSLPATLSMVATVHGLDNTRRAHPKMRIAQIGARASLTIPGVAQSTIKSAYGFNPIYQSGLTGKGQHIAVATYDDFNTSDVTTFYQLSNLNPVPSVDKVNFNGTPNMDENSAMETELDAEFTGMIAPGASVHVFTSAENSDAGELAMFTAILDDNRAKVVNYSWGSCETTLTPAHQAEMAKVFARAVAQGVNVMVASGDSGSDSCQDGTVAADWPAANPNVVAIGGTTFGQNGGQLAETGWSGSGGGISKVWELPAYQNSLGGIFTKRSYPDVSFNADPASGQGVYVTYGGSPQWISIGGTSMAAPQWSGFMALVGEARANAGKQPLGYLNPIIYGFSTSDLAATFNDVTSGNNGQYNAGPGYDAVTGLGSMQGQALLTKLQSF